MLPLFIASHFGEHYQVLAQGQVSVSNGELITTTDETRLFSIITHELTISAEEWRGVLMRLGVSVPPNFFHTGDIYHELVKLFQRRQLLLVKIPRLEQLPAIKAEEGWGYCFTPGPQRHPSHSYSPVAVHSVQDAQALLAKINISKKELSRLLPSMSVSSPTQLAELLANKSVLAYKVPVASAAPTPKAVEFLPATAADKPVPLAPESKETTPAPKQLKPLEGDKVFKRTHSEGNAEDPYTLMADGKPLGANEGVMPTAFQGLDKFPKENTVYIEQGFPDVVTRKDFKNFSDIQPKELPPGTKIYRIVDEGSSEASGNSGCYWAYSKPANKTEWRSKYAVKDSWNDNGYYVEHTVGEGGLKVWEGTVAGQRYVKHQNKLFYLEGGETQLYVAFNAIGKLTPKLTNWLEA